LGNAVKALTPLLTVTKIGKGIVTSSPTGINCGTDCTQAYTVGTPVTLTATPLGNAPFLGWSGEGCSGTGTCEVTMDQDRTVTADFYTFPWVMFQAAFTSGGGSSPVVDPNAYWGVDNDVCCTTSSATFYLTLDGVTRTSNLSTCAGPSTWDGWATTTPGAKDYLWEWTSSGCGTTLGPFPYTLQQGLYHLFVLGWNGTSFTMTIYTSATASAARPPVTGSGPISVADGLDSWQRSDEIVLDIPAGVVPPPKGILKATN